MEIKELKKDRLRISDKDGNSFTLYFEEKSNRLFVHNIRTGQITRIRITEGD